MCTHAQQNSKFGALREFARSLSLSIALISRRFVCCVGGSSLTYPIGGRIVAIGEHASGRIAFVYRSFFIIPSLPLCLSLAFRAHISASQQHHVTVKTKRLRPVFGAYAATRRPTTAVVARGESVIIGVCVCAPRSRRYPQREWQARSLGLMMKRNLDGRLDSGFFLCVVGRGRSLMFFFKSPSKKHGRTSIYLVLR